MTPTLLLGVDGSAAARAAVEAAGPLAERLGLELVLAHAVDDRPRFPYGDTARADRRSRRLSTEARDLLDRLASEGAPARRCILHGEPAEALARAAETEGAAIVAVASRRDSPLRSLFASVSRSLVALAHRPVLVFPGRVAERRGLVGSSVVCGHDGSDEGEAAADAAARVAERAGLALLVVRTVDPLAGAGLPSAGTGALPDHHARALVRQASSAERAAARASRAIESERVEVTAVTEAGDAADRLAERGGEDDVAMVVVGSRRPGRLRSALGASTSAALTAAARCPVLVVPAGAPALRLDG